jgi:hypothetical protein
MRRTAALGVACLGLTGCFSNGLWEGASSRVQKIRTPLTEKQTHAQQVTGQRVEVLGRQIVTQNTFTGIEPVFHFLGVKDPTLFHKGTEELFISEGLVKKCKTDDELAAVLCSELGKMVAEKRAGIAVGRDSDPLLRGPGGKQDVGEDVPGAVAVGVESTPTRAWTKADTDAVKIAEGLLRGAGFDPALLEQVAPLLKEADRHDAIRKQLSAPAAAPVWKK